MTAVGVRPPVRVGVVEHSDEKLLHLQRLSCFDLGPVSEYALATRRAAKAEHRERGERYTDSVAADELAHAIRRAVGASGDGEPIAKPLEILRERGW